jgi:choice-of-anchor B domain-containing protein
MKRLLLLIGWLLLAGSASAQITGGRVACTGGFAAGYPCLNVDLLAYLPISSIGGTSGIDLNDIWGWVDPITGKEYALVGRSNGTAFVDVTDPVNPIYLGQLMTHTSTSLWRDIKVYQDHAFIVSEASGHGMQVFDLTRLRGLTGPPVTFTEDAHYNKIGNTHNIYINEASGYAYLIGSTFGTSFLCSGGPHIVNIQDPLNPVMEACYGGDGYTHDIHCVNYVGPDTEHQGKEICAASNEDTVTILDVTNKSSIQMLSRNTYPQSAYTHQGWFTEDHRYFLCDDELDETSFGFNTRTHIWDLADLDVPVRIGTFTHDVASIDHNQYVKGHYSFQSNYTSGLRILDIADINAPTLAGHFDTYTPNNSKSFLGSWSNYPFLPSGNVVVSSIDEGLFVVDPTFDNDEVAAVTIDLIPAVEDIVVPPQGGNFNYTVTFVNTTQATRTETFWFVMQQDNGAFTQSRGPFSVTLGPGATFTRNFRQRVAGTAPADTYTYTGYVGGTFPDVQSALDSDSFPFSKSATIPSSDVDFSLYDADTDALIEDGASFSTFDATASEEEDLPQTYVLGQNYPNPFNPQTTIPYQLKEAANVSLAVYNALGQHVRTLEAGLRPVGAYTLVWDGRNEAGQAMPSGVYLYRLKAGSTLLTRTMTLMK